MPSGSTCKFIGKIKKVSKPSDSWNRTNNWHSSCLDLNAFQAIRNILRKTPSNSLVKHSNHVLFGELRPLKLRYNSLIGCHTDTICRCTKTTKILKLWIFSPAFFCCYWFTKLISRWRHKPSLNETLGQKKVNGRRLFQRCVDKIEHELGGRRRRSISWRSWCSYIS